VPDEEAAGLLVADGAETHVSIRPHTSAYVSIVPDEEAAGLLVADGAETLLPQRLVQTCTFVPVKQVN
jgi:hypothetical protein